jgi:hypothetical protein
LAEAGFRSGKSRRMPAARRRQLPTFAQYHPGIEGSGHCPRRVRRGFSEKLWQNLEIPPESTVFFQIRAEFLALPPAPDFLAASEPESPAPAAANTTPRRRATPRRLHPGLHDDRKRPCPFLPAEGKITSRLPVSSRK